MLTCWKQRFRWQLQKYCVYKCTDNCKGNVWRDERGSSTQTKAVENHKKAVWLWGSKWACWWCKSKIWRKKKFYVVVNTALSSLDERFQTLEEVNVLLNFPNMSKEELPEYCQTLSTALSHDGQPDIDGRELASEMQNFPHLPSKNMTNIDLLTFLHKKKLTEIYPNMWIALRISATLPVTVAAAERSFSKLKLIKNYLRSTIAQERLGGLSVIGINHVVSQLLYYNDIRDDFAAWKARRVRL